MEGPQDAEAQSLFTALTTYLAYGVLFFFGHLRDLFAKVTGITRFGSELFVKTNGEAPLLDPYGNAFYRRRLQFRINDCFDRPINSRPGAHISVMIRKRAKDQISWELSDETVDAINLGSYNYLGFADDWNSTCGKPVRDSLIKYGPSCQSAYTDAGYMAVHKQLEKYVAKFVGKEDSLVFNMGYGTNSQAIPALMGSGSLIISDTLNHTSLVNGCRDAGSKTKAFAHNDFESLERTIKEAIVEGQPTKDKSYKAWSKILVMVEGIYSMEGEICRFREIVDIAKKYKCYVYVDEAHSIGALGKTGRGVCEHTGVQPDEIDIMMGTFTKSFGGMGGYIAGSKELINYLRANNSGSLQGSLLSPVVAQQVLTAFEIIDGKICGNTGQEKLDLIKSNANYFRNQLKHMGCSVLGDDDSPVVPVMLFNPTKIGAFSRECLKRGIAVVVVGAPAVPIYGARVRFCISAAHKKSELKEALKKIREVTKILNIQYEKSMIG